MRAPGNGTSKSATKHERQNLSPDHLTLCVP